MHPRNPVPTLRSRLAPHGYWARRLDGEISTFEPTVHLAVLVEPFLTHILEGQKKLESRFSKRRSLPFGRIAARDIIVLKRSGGPIVGVCEAAAVWSFPITSLDLEQLRPALEGPLCANGDDFWQARADSRFVTLISVTRVERIDPLPYPKRDRRPWLTWDPKCSL